MTGEDNKIRECTLSTIDNPFNPFDDFREWLRFDVEKGYYTCNILGRIVGDYIPDDLTKKEVSEAVESIIDEFLLNEPTGTFIKVTRTTDY